MSHKVAIFSDGHKDVYKGNRDVKAAWAIYDKATGEFLLSGHSIDRNRAEKLPLIISHILEMLLGSMIHLSRFQKLSSQSIMVVI